MIGRLSEKGREVSLEGVGSCNANECKGHYIHIWWLVWKV